MAGAANTPAMAYVDTKDEKAACKQDNDDITKRCAPNDKSSDRRKLKPKSRDNHKDAGKEAGWVLDHCGPLLMKPGDDFEEWYGKFGKIDALMKKAAVKLKDDVIVKLEQEILEYGAKAAGKMAVRRGLTGWIPVVGWIMTAVDVVVTAVDVASKVSEAKETIAELKRNVEALRTEADKVTDAFKDYKDKLRDFPNMSQKDKDAVIREVMADVQTAYAAANPCLRAKKCALVPFNKGYRC